MLDRSTNVISALLVIFMALAGMSALGRIPADSLVAIHFDVSGTPNGWAPAWIGLSLLPSISSFAWLLLHRLPAIDPSGDNVLRSRHAVRAIWLASIAVIALAQLLIVTQALGMRTPLGPVIGTTVGVVLAAIGNVMGKLRWNYTIGIRTPWTLFNERVWDKTHRFAGKVFVLVGAAIAACSWFPAIQGIQKPVVISGIILVVVLPVLKSYLLWKDENRSSA